jgi:SAM-dependent methyltransferase
MMNMYNMHLRYESSRRIVLVMSAAFFTWLSRADFYASAHAETASLVPAGGRTWVDVGCGPGLLTRLAARLGFEARGYDVSPEMVRAARAQAMEEHVGAAFEVAALEEVKSRCPPADVVLAASLLAVLPRRRRALEALWELVAPRGTLLLVETTPHMRARSTLRLLSGRGAPGLLLWGFARGGRSAAADIEAFRPPGVEASSFHPLLGGLLGAWLLHRAPSSGAHFPKSSTGG